MIEQFRRLDHLAEVYPSTVDKKTNEGEEDVRLCNYKEVYDNETINNELDFMEATASPSEIEKFSLKSGDILLTKDSESWDDIGVPAFVPEDLPGVLSGYHLFVVRPDPNKVHPYFLYWALASRLLAFQFERDANGVTRYGLTTHDARRALVPLPPREKQEKLATNLEKQLEEIKALRESKIELLDLMDERRTAILTHAVTGNLWQKSETKDTKIDWLGEIPVDWVVSPLKYQVDIDSGKTPTKSEDRYWDGDIPWFTAKDMKSDFLVESEVQITTEAVEETNISLYLPGTTLVVVRGMILDHTFPVGITKDHATINQDMKALQPGDDIMPEYLFRMMQGLAPPILSMVEESAHGTKRLDSDRLENLKVPIPPKSDQERLLEMINEELDRMASLENKLHSTLSLLREKEESIITASITGQSEISRAIESN